MMNIKKLTKSLQESLEIIDETDDEEFRELEKEELSELR